MAGLRFETSQPATAFDRGRAGSEPVHASRGAAIDYMVFRAVSHIASCAVASGRYSYLYSPPVAEGPNVGG